MLRCFVIVISDGKGNTSYQSRETMNEALQVYVEALQSKLTARVYRVRSNNAVLDSSPETAPAPRTAPTGEAPKSE